MFVAYDILKRVPLVPMVIALSLFGCNTSPRQDYPRELYQIDEITQAMQQLESHMHQLQDLTRSDRPSPQARQEIVGALNGMDQSAARLSASGWPSTHPPFETRLDTFRSDIKSARAAAEREPPDYSGARSIQEACFTCHKGQ